MAYEANRSGDPELEKERNDANNANNIRNAADVAIASGNPYAAGAGLAVKGVDAVTGGKGSEIAGKALTNANKVVPGGKKLQDVSNDLSESGASDKIGKAASMYNQAKGQPDEKVVPERKNQVPPNQMGNTGGEQQGSLPSSSDEKEKSSRREESKEETPNDSSEEKEKKKRSLLGGIVLSAMAKMILFIITPLLIGFLFLMLVISIVSGMFTGYQDAFGVSQTVGEETGNIYTATSADQQAFYDRINNLKAEYEASGQEFDPLKIVGVYHVLKEHGANIDYDDMTDSVIREIADAMMEDGFYSSETFKQKLIDTIIPRYLPKTSKDERERIAQEVLDYVDNYYDLIGKENENSSSSSSFCAANNCSYDIKGYYIRGKGNVAENKQVSNLYVRLMQCGSASGHNYGGTFGKPLEGEDLIPFEKYILGVAYQTISEDAGEDAIKAQMVAARSYILARHADLGGWRTLQKEDDKWVLQVAACNQDQAYCDPDKGCSGTSAQWGQIYSGLDHNQGFKKEPLSLGSNLRSYAADTSGEVVTNEEGYIVYTGYQQAEQNQFISLGKSGVNYKQILLQVYNQGTRNYGAKNVEKASCKADSSYCGVSSGEFASWKQFKGPWTNVQIGSSGKTIQQIGCLATSVAILIAKSGVPTKVSPFNPGTFVEYISARGGFSGGNFVWRAASIAAPNFHYQGKVGLAGLSRAEKLDKIRELANQQNVYVVAEVKGDTGQHWVAIDSVNGDTINMMDPGSNSTNMWQQYPWGNTSCLAYFKVG